MHNGATDLSSGANRDYDITTLLMSGVRVGCAGRSLYQTAVPVRLHLLDAWGGNELRQLHLPWPFSVFPVFCQVLFLPVRYLQHGDAPKLPSLLQFA